MLRVRSRDRPARQAVRQGRVDRDPDARPDQGAAPRPLRADAHAIGAHDAVVHLHASELERAAQAIGEGAPRDDVLREHERRRHALRGQLDRIGRSEDRWRRTPRPDRSRGACRARTASRRCRRASPPRSGGAPVMRSRVTTARAWTCSRACAAKRAVRAGISRSSRRRARARRSISSRRCRDRGRGSAKRKLGDEPEIRVALLGADLDGDTPTRSVHALGAGHPA